MGKIFQKAGLIDLIRLVLVLYLIQYYHQILSDLIELMKAQIAVLWLRIERAIQSEYHIVKLVRFLRDSL